jgi:NADPH-dependent 2,4-dienoyl-CoA reductase/sulfur reductase-like enzyme
MGNEITRKSRSYRPPRLEDDLDPTEHTPLRNPSANEGSNKPSTTSPTNKKKIAIIGAGVSGIICGSVLQENEYEVTLFDNSDRVGVKIALYLCIYKK